MQVDGSWPHASETDQAGFGEALEAFGNIQVGATSHKFITTITDSLMSAVANVSPRRVPFIDLYNQPWIYQEMCKST